MSRPRVPGLSDEWAEHQLDLLGDLRAAMDAVEAAPVRPDPPVCRQCEHVADVPGGAVFACRSAAGCALDALGPEKTRERGAPCLACTHVDGRAWCGGPGDGPCADGGPAGRSWAVEL